MKWLTLDVKSAEIDTFHMQLLVGAAIEQLCSTAYAADIQHLIYVALNAHCYEVLKHMWNINCKKWGGQDRVAIKRPLCKNKDVGLNPAATRNENGR